jgi:DNA topoisomerase-1
MSPSKRTPSSRKTPAPTAKAGRAKAKKPAVEVPEGAPGAEEGDGRPEADGEGGKGASRTGRSLVIVESPAKAKTINKFLGRKFVVRASMGHVRDLPKSQLGVDVERGFRLTYQALPDRKHVLDAIRKEAAKAPAVYLAPDPDREGEAIAWHLKEALRLPADRTYRVTFNAITKSEVTKAFEHPRTIDMALVDAQQARRVLDRLVGYQVSPLLWKKVTRGLSAGRVQSVALGLLVDREREIEAFRREPYWKVGAVLKKPGVDPSFEATLERVDGGPAKSIPESDPKGLPKALAEAVVADILGEEPGAEAASRTRGAPKPPKAFVVTAVDRKERRDRPRPPFTTATLQQQASIVLRFGAKRTMMLAQRLYEGVAIPGEGHVALITYMRTDSTRVAPEAVEAARAHVREAYGERYLPSEPNRYASGKKAQEAHEAVRPTEPGRTPESLRGKIDPAQWRLYDLVWRRFVASQMTPAVIDATTADVSAGRGVFRARGEVVRFDGHTRVLGNRGEAVALPPLAEGETLERVSLEVTAHETQPPPRYTEAGLVKALEQNGVGRPSTYASILSTIQDRGYANLVERKFHATPLGKVVTDLLRPAFPELFRIDFTAAMEDRLDKIEEGERWTDVLDDFWEGFKKELDHAEEKMPDRRSVEAPADMRCPECQAPMVGKWSSKSQFFGCSRWPDCKGTRGGEGEKRVAAEPTPHVCPKCGKPLVIRTGRRGRFIACSGYPECKHTSDVDEAGNPVERPSIGEEVLCEKCGKPMVLRWSRRGPFLGCSGYPKCRGTRQLTPAQLAKVPPRRPRFTEPPPDEPRGTPEEGDPVEDGEADEGRGEGDGAP